MPSPNRQLASRARPAGPGALALVASLAWAGLWRRPLGTALLLAAIAAAVAFQIPNAANLAGYDAEILRQGLVAGFGDVRVRPRDGDRFDDGDALAARLARRPGVLAAVPVLALPGAVAHRGRTKEAMILGVDPAAPRVPFDTSGVPAPAPGGETVLLPGPLADRLRVRAGDRVTLRILLGAGPLDGPDVARHTATVAGVARGSFASPDGVILHRAFLAERLGTPGAASVVLVHLDRHDDAGRAAEAIRAAEPSVEARAWRDDVPFLASSLDGSRAVGQLSRAMAIIAVLVPVWALLHMDRLHRRRELAILRALGLTRTDLVAVCEAQAALVALPGVILGAALGLGLCTWFDRHPIFTAGSFVIRPELGAGVLVSPMLTVLVAALAAALVPAVAAARTDTAGVLRGNE